MPLAFLLAKLLAYAGPDPDTGAIGDTDTDTDTDSDSDSDSDSVWSSVTDTYVTYQIQFDVAVQDSEHYDCNMVYVGPGYTADSLDGLRLTLTGSGRSSRRVARTAT